MNQFDIICGEECNWINWTMNDSIPIPKELEIVKQERKLNMRYVK